ncbi:MAG: hypothetical protein GF398_19545 [Chitinivibrionales bacterium]|nr:hypothetical protein [Chitinivibrionales bacterium]
MSKRWYDGYEKLAFYLEQLKGMEHQHRDKLIKAILEIIRAKAPHLMEDFLLEFPLDMQRRRWYDQDPYLWLMINGMRFGEDDLIKEVIDYFEKAQGVEQPS